MARENYDPAPPVPVAISQTEATPPERIGAEPSQFGGLLGGAEQQAGATVEGAGEKAAQTGLQLANFYNEANAQGAENQWVDSATKQLYDGQTGLYAKKGLDAVQAWPAFQSSLALSRQQISANLPNDRQRLLFDTLTRRTYDYHLMSAARYVDEQQSGYADAQWKAGRALSENMALSHVNDDTQWQGDLQDTLNKTEAYGRSKGFPEEVIQNDKNEVTSRLYGQRIAVMAITNPTGAKALYDQNQDKLAPQMRIELGKELERKAGDAETDGFISNYFGTAPGQAGADAVWERIKKQESGGRQFDTSGKLVESNVGGDNPIGISQIRPTTARGVAASLGVPFDEQKLRTDAQYNELLGKAYFQQLTSKYGGNAMLASAAYNAGPGNVDKWITQFGDPRTGAISDSDFAAKIPVKETHDYVQAVGAVGAPPPPTAVGQMPDKSAFYKAAIEQFGNDPDRLQKVIEKGNRQFALIEGVTATERTALERDQTNMQAALENGVNVPLDTIEPRIRAVFPPEEAQRRIQLLDVSKYAGILYQGVQWGSPEDIARTAADLSTGTGVTGALLRARLSSGKTPAVSVEGQAAPPGEGTGEAESLRLQIQAKFATMVENRRRLLAADPAGYVASNPLVASARAAINPDDPSTYEAFATQSRAIQTQLGVPTQQQHLMTADQAAAQARQFETLDPKEADAGALLGQMQRSAGKEWPQMFGDMVSLGKLPGQYQVLAAMPDPVQRAEFQRALQTIALKGGVEKLKSDAPDAAVKTIDQDIDGKLDDFRRTAMFPGGVNNTELVSQVKNSIKAFAYYKSMQMPNADGDTALSAATDAILNNKYDFGGQGGTMQNLRTPKGMLGIMEQSAGALLDRLTPDDIGGNLVGTPGHSPELLKAATLEAARGRSARWLTNENDTGMYLTVQGTDGSVQTLRRPDGKRIELPFAASEPLPPGMAGPVEGGGAGVAPAPGPGNMAIP